MKEELSVSEDDSYAVIVDNISKSYRRISALQNIHLKIPTGRIFGLLGPDGAGKSTMLKIIAGVTHPTSGRCLVMGKDIVKDTEQLRKVISFMPQGLGLILSDKLTVKQNLDFFANIYHIEPELALKRRDELLKVTNLYDFQNRIAGKLSGGMQQKLALCCTLIHHPKLLILDEPTTGVDPVSRRELWAIINELVVSEGITVIIATSYLDEAERCHYLAMMHNGKILRTGQPDQLGQDNNQNISDVFVDELLDVMEHHHIKADLSQFAEKTIHLPINKDEPVVNVSNLTKRFGKFTAVDSINFEIYPGEIFGFLGPNGAGKTTTIKMLCGILRPTAGQAFVAGFNIRHQQKNLKNRIGYMSQKFSLYNDLTVIENLKLYKGVYGRCDHPVLNLAELLEVVGLRGFESRMTKDLPVGLKQRLALACSMVHLPDVLFLDEPTSGVDPLARERFWEIVRFLSRQMGITLLLTTHYMDEAEFCDRLAMIHRGNIVALDIPENLKKQTEKEKGTLLEILCENYMQAYKLLLQQFDSVTFFGRKLHLFSKDQQKDIEKIKLILTGDSFTDLKISIGKIRLEDAFIHFVS